MTAKTIPASALVLSVLVGACDVKLPGADAEKAAPAPVAEAKAPTETPPPPDTKATPVSTPEVLTPEVDPKTGTTVAVAPTSGEARIEDERNNIDLFHAAAPATVFVTQTAEVIDRFSMRTTEVPAGAGTGFVWDTEGHVVTNCHVAMANCQAGVRARKLSVTMFDHKVYEAKVVGHDPFRDIAVLKIEPGETKLVPIRRPEKGYKLEVGQKAAAIGNPFGLDHTLTVGVISALDREVKGIGEVTIRGMVQTDAAINPGNSGGPLLDSRGQLIGMNTMIFSASGSSAGIGFAVPVTSIERVVPQIIRTGFPERVGLGIERVNDEIALRLGIEGVIVRSVQPGSPADKAGLRSAKDTATGPQLDVIVGVDDKRVKTFDDLYGALEDRSEGDVVRLSVRRMPPDEVVTLEVALVKLATSR